LLDFTRENRIWSLVGLLGFEPRTKAERMPCAARRQCATSLSVAPHQPASWRSPRATMNCGGGLGPIRMFISSSVKCGSPLRLSACVGMPALLKMLIIFASSGGALSGLQMPTDTPGDKIACENCISPLWLHRGVVFAPPSSRTRKARKRCTP